ncbi:MAG TPA: hypothetical protein VFD27_09375 [Chthoniobacteraceae bacterium]|nr:hypothetical protein [Chthoniobacteraceae bacterium]
MSYDETLNRIKGARGRTIVLPGTLLSIFMLLISSGLDAQDVTSPPQTGAAISRRMLVDPSSTTVTLGKISLIVGPLTPKGNIYVGDYQIKVVPYFYKSETGTLKLNAPDGTARKFAEGNEVTFTGTATNNKGGKTKLIIGKATPSDKDKGSVTFYVETDNGRMTFKTSYRFAK